MVKKNNLKSILKKTWHFIWEDDSIWSWIANIILAFVLIKFIVYPGLGFILSTSYPIVAVVSGSMEHGYLGADIGSCGTTNERWVSFDQYWDECGTWYEKNTDITKEEFIKYSFKNGFNKGDIMILKGKQPKDIQIGEIIVFRSKRPDPIIHRVIKKWEENGTYYFQTKGDHNKNLIRNSYLDEIKISENDIIGRAVFRIPLLGYVKIWFVELIKLFM
jgi:signal peptidase I